MYNLTERPIILPDKNLTMDRQGQGPSYTLTSFLEEVRVWIFTVGGLSWMPPGNATAKPPKRRRHASWMRSARRRAIIASMRSGGSAGLRNAGRRNLPFVGKGSRSTGRP